jgi:hypothetical protein
MPKTKSDKTLSTTKTEARKRRREWLIVVVIVGLVALSLQHPGSCPDQPEHPPDHFLSLSGLA